MYIEIITIINEPSEQTSTFDSCDDNCANYVDNHNIQENKDTDIVQMDVSNDQINNITENTADWSKNSVQNLRTPKSRILTVGDGSNFKRKRNEYDAMCSKVSHWAASKATLESEKIRFAEEEHKKKIQLLQQKCDIECELMRKESEARLKRIEQETQVTIDNLIEYNNLRKEILLLEKHVLLQKIQNTST
nr:unnamed protein product [Callosobruchus chinensis]